MSRDGKVDAVLRILQLIPCRRGFWRRNIWLEDERDKALLLRKQQGINCHRFLCGGEDWIPNIEGAIQTYRLDCVYELVSDDSIFRLAVDYLQHLASLNLRSFRVDAAHGRRGARRSV